jgi:hypothetical protein
MHVRLLTSSGTHGLDQFACCELALPADSSRAFGVPLGRLRLAFHFAPRPEDGFVYPCSRRASEGLVPGRSPL